MTPAKSMFETEGKYKENNTQNLIFGKFVRGVWYIGFTLYCHKTF